MDILRMHEEDILKNLHEGMVDVTTLDEKEIYKAIANEKSTIENIVGGEILFGRIAGSMVQGLNSKASDLDVHLFITGGEDFQRQASKEANLPKVGGGKLVGISYVGAKKKIELDIDIIFWDDIQKRLRGLEESRKKYPTTFYRNEEVSPVVRYRSDYGEWMHQLWILSDSVWISDAIGEEELKGIYGLKKVIDILDALFTRANGNYNKFIMPNISIPVRKYMYTLHHIESAKWIIEKKTKPPMKFYELLKGNKIADEVRSQIDILYEANKNGTEYKTKNFVPSNKIVNEYIGESLQYLISKIENFDGEKTYLDIINNTPILQRANIWNTEKLLSR